jgi:NAD-dependent SIR2 family protein deacetylase
MNKAHIVVLSGAGISATADWKLFAMQTACGQNIELKMSVTPEALIKILNWCLIFT